MHTTPTTDSPRDSWQPVIAFVTGVIVAVLAGQLLPKPAPTQLSTAYDEHDHSHTDTEVHVHSDFIVFLNGTELDLSDDAYMSTANQVMHDHIHLHDNNGYILHRHAEGVTVADFFDSLGFTLTDSCFTTDTGIRYCSNDDQELILFVNGARIEEPTRYINQDNDRFLLYYGAPTDTDTIASLQARITDEACIYSLTCPERGTPPPESCGLTCDI